MKINNISFGSGYTKAIERKVKNTDIKKTEESLEKDGIYADFQGSKEIAQCTEQTVKIFKAFNVGLPLGVFAKNFDTSPFDSNIHGKADIKGNIFFNSESFKNLKFLDYVATIAREKHLVPTGHFMGVFLHEFSHMANFRKFSQNKSSFTQLSDIQGIYAPLKLKKYILEKDGYYLPAEDMAEVFAYSMEKRIADTLDEKTMLPKTNPFEDLYSKSQKTKEEAVFNEILKSIYEGDLKRLNFNLRLFH